MKIFLFLAATVISLSAYCQTFICQSNTMDGVNIINAPLKKPSIISNPHYFNPVDLTEYSYDSVRELTEINIPNEADAHPWISSDGLRLYYTNPSNKLVMTERTDINSYFGTPMVVQIPNYLGISYWLSTDELDLYFSDFYYIYYTHRAAINLPFSSPQYVEMDGMGEPEYISAPSLNADQDELYLHTYPPDKIMVFSLYGGFYYGYERTLPAPIGFSLLGGQLSKDDLTYFTTAEDPDGKFMLYQMTRTTLSDTFDISTFQLIEGINDTAVVNAFPSMSDSLEWVAFNRSPFGSWNTIDLFLAYKGILTSVFNPAETQIASYAYPNPASEYVCINYQTPSMESLMVFVYSYEGVLVFEEVLNPADGVVKINTSRWNNGFYCYRLIQTANKKNGAITGKFVVMN